MSKIQTRRCISVSNEFYERLLATEMPRLPSSKSKGKGNKRRGPVRRDGRISRTGFVEQKILEALDAEGWPRASPPR